MAVLYRHIRLDTNEVFYIGIGKSEKRSKSKDSRNAHWKNIINKTEYEIQILKNDLTWEDACELEEILILYYGRKDLGTGILVNMTNGGDGHRGMSDESKKKISQANKGKIGWNKGKKLHPLSDEHKKKLSLSHKGRTISKEHKEALIKANIGKKHTDATKKKLSDLNKGKEGPNKLGIEYYYKILNLLEDGLRPFEIMIELNISNPTYYRLIKRNS